jgi:hypothetical protein
MGNRHETLTAEHLSSSFARYQKNNVFHVHQKTKITVPSQQTLHIIFNTPQATAFAEATVKENTWSLKIWYPNIICLDEDLLNLLLYTTYCSMPPHYETTLPEPIFSHQPKQLQLGDSEYEEDWEKVFSLFEKTITEEYKKFFFQDILFDHPHLTIENIQITENKNGFLNLKIFATQELSTFVLKISEENLTLRLGELLGSEESTEYSINYSAIKTLDSTDAPNIHTSITEIFNKTTIKKEVLNHVFGHAMREAQKLRSKHLVKY